MRLRPALLDLVIYQGATFALTLRLRDKARAAPLDLGPRTARMHIRARIADPDPACALSTEDGRIAITAAEGLITLHLPAAVTAALTLPQGGVYDLELIDDQGGVDRILMGRVTLDPEVTR
jgi:hypothetical protein